MNHRQFFSFHQGGPVERSQLGLPGQPTPEQESVHETIEQLSTWLVQQKIVQLTEYYGRPPHLLDKLGKWTTPSHAGRDKKILYTCPIDPEVIRTREEIARIASVYSYNTHRVDFLIRAIVKTLSKEKVLHEDLARTIRDYIRMHPAPRG